MDTIAVLAPLLKLPPELTERIADFLRIESPKSDNHENKSAATDAATATNASKKSMDDFRAFRLTCRDVYLKTHRLFGHCYFSTVSVGFTLASLNRLRDMASYKNAFGLTVSRFPSQLLVSTHRLPSGSKAGSLLSVSKNIDPSADAHAIVACITMACRLGIKNSFVHGPYSSDIHGVAGQYRRAVLDQQVLTILDLDVNMIGLAMAAFPKFDNVTLDALCPSWGEQDWQLLAGIDRKSFTNFGDLDSGQSNADFAMNRIMQAIAHAETLCRAGRRDLDLFTIDAFSRAPTWDGKTKSRQNISLQTLDISPSKQKSLQAIFSWLADLSINLNDFVRGECLKREGKKIKRALGLLLSSSILSDLSVAFEDPSEDLDGELRNANRPSHEWFGDHMLSMIAETERSKCLECLQLYCNAIVESTGALEKLVKRHTATLTQLTITTQVFGSVDLDLYDARTQCLGLVRAISDCSHLRDVRLSFSLDKTLTNVVEIEVSGKDAIAARLRAIIASHIGPEYDSIWDDNSTEDDSTEDGSAEDDSTEDDGTESDNAEE
jgi:hypothetical protein